MSIGFWQIAIVVILVVLLFGRGKISSLMGDVAKGIKSFKKGMATDSTEDLEPKNISENNQDSDINQDSDSNQDSNNKE
tara:strand:- start:318 stop:554 length:237 start_codon:yes stop_codon:yes gene_type:complete